MIIVIDLIVDNQQPITLITIWPQASEKHETTKLESNSTQSILNTNFSSLRQQIQNSVQVGIRVINYIRIHKHLVDWNQTVRLINYNARLALK